MLATLTASVHRCGLLVGCLALAMDAASQNTNGQPGFWLPRIDHGDHLIGCAGANNTERFYPIHGCLIPVGPYRGCVLVWEKGGQQECLLQFPSPTGSDVDVRWAIFDPRTSPPTIHKFAWRIPASEAPPPPCFATAPAGYQGLFCAGHCWLPDGRLLVVGGDYWAQSVLGGCNGTSNPAPDFAGSRLVAVFDPRDIDVNQPHQLTNGPGSGRPWTNLNPTVAGGTRLEEARWYPSVTLMAPANFGVGPTQNPLAFISVAGGVQTFTDGVPAPDPGDPSYDTHELFTWSLAGGLIDKDMRPSASGTNGLFLGPTTPNAGALSFLYYPRMHFVSKRPGAPDGRLWMAGMAAQSADADVINLPDSWVNTGPTLPLSGGNTMVEESMAVLFPPVTPLSRDLQLVMGGSEQNASHSPTATVTNACHLMATRNAPPAWLPFPSMIHARKFGNAVLLPDASILVVGGGTGIGHGTSGGAQLEAEVFYNGTWMRLSDQFSERTYHSVALLLEDGRVLSAGGDTCPDDAEYEIFEPHYLAAAPIRPTLAGGQPGVLHYGQSADFGYGIPFGQAVDRVVLMRPGSVTHSQDPGQRYEPLTFAHIGDSSDQNNIIRVHAPADATLFPPGYAMMFLVSSTGVPSLAHWVQVIP